MSWRRLAIVYALVVSGMFLWMLAMLADIRVALATTIGLLLWSTGLGYVALRSRSHTTKDGTS